MITLRNYRIVKIDNLNYSFQVFRTPEETQRTKSLEPKWIPSHRYYATIEQCLDGIKRDLIQAQIDLKDYSKEEFIKMLEEIQEAINNLDIKINM